MAGIPDLHHLSTRFPCCRKGSSIFRTKSSKARDSEKSAQAEDPEQADDMSYQQDPLLNHPHFKKIKDLNEGTFGFVQLAKDTRKDEPVRTLLLLLRHTISR